MLKLFEIVLVPFPFTDLTSSKIRPALVIANEKNNLVLLFITTNRLRAGEYSVELDETDAQASGLKEASCIVCSHIATLEKNIVLGTIGSLHKGYIPKVKVKLETFLGL